jgi:hypothetical protein
VLAACAASSEIKYTATYNGTGSFMIERMALEATAGQGYQVAKDEHRRHDYVFVTLPVHLDAADQVDVGFLVQIVYEVEARDRKRFSVLVQPRAYVDDLEVSNDRLPPSAMVRARQLSDAIRAHSRPYEAPAI